MTGPPGFRGVFRTDLPARAVYAEGAGIFRIVPGAVAVPVDTPDLQCLVRWAAERRIPLVARGAGSGMPGGNVGAGVVVDLTQGFRHPAVVDPDARTVSAGAGTTCRELNGAAAAYGLRLPPVPSSSAFATLGGMVACNAAGAHSLKHGAVRGWVDALDFVTADGETGRAGTADPGGEVAQPAAVRRLLADVAPWLRQHQRALEAALPATRKNSSGYLLAHQPDDGWVRHALIGSEGTLALVTGVDLRLAPLPEDPTTLLVTLASLEDVTPAVKALAPLEPAAVELLDRTYLDFVRAAAGSRIPPGTEAVLLVEFETDGHDAERALAGIAASTVVARDAQAASRLWELRHLASPILAGLPDSMRSLQVVEDGCVPLDALGTYIAGLRAIATAAGFEVVIFGHAGDGHVHANLLADVQAPDLAERLDRCLAEASALQIRLGGTLAGEHGDGRLRAGYTHTLLGPEYTEACRRVKQAMDPHDILNPGVKFAPPAALEAGGLKIGPGAAALPPGAAAALREIERTAGWGVFRLDVLGDA